MYFPIPIFQRRVLPLAQHLAVSSACRKQSASDLEMNETWHTCISDCLKKFPTVASPCVRIDTRHWVQVILTSGAAHSSVTLMSIRKYHTVTGYCSQDDWPLGPNGSDCEPPSVTLRSSLTQIVAPIPQIWSFKNRCEPIGIALSDQRIGRTLY